MEQHSSGKRPDVGHVFSFCVSQTAFHTRQILYRVSNIHQTASVSGNFGAEIQRILDLSINSSGVQGPNSPFYPFVEILDHVAVPAQEVNSAFLVQDNIMGHIFSQRSFSSVSGISMLNAPVASAADVGDRASFDPWKNIRLHSQTDFIDDMKRCRNDLLVRRKNWNDSSECAFGLERVASSVISEHIGKADVRTSNIVEVGNFQFRSDGLHYPGCPGTSRGTPSPCKGNLRERTSSHLLSKRNISLAESHPST